MNRAKSSLSGSESSPSKEILESECRCFILFKIFLFKISDRTSFLDSMKDILSKNTAKEDMEKNFNEGLFRNVEDWPNRENSQRQFFTMPTGGNPPDTRAFAEFLYGNAKNCKADSKQCV